MAGWWRRSGASALGSEADRATFRTLHTASLAAPALRAGLTAVSSQRAAPHLRALLGVPDLAITDAVAALAWDGTHDHHREQVGDLARSTVATGATALHDRSEFPCDKSSCPIRQAVVVPLTVEESVIGTLQVFTSSAGAGLVRASEEVARWVSGQLELAELDASRTRLMEAEVRALRAQISPHFIYNSLTAIASFTRTDPERARELLLEFADFTRYSFRKHGEFTTLAEELRSIERYLALEKARFGERLVVTLRVAPEVLPVAVPFLCLQPLVENAIKHGLESRQGAGHIAIIGEDVGSEAEISVEDDGAGQDPDHVRRVLAGDSEIDSVGLGNVDSRLRSAFGDDYGLVVETALGAGTKVTLRVPKFAAGVHA